MAVIFLVPLGRLINTSDDAQDIIKRRKGGKTYGPRKRGPTLSPPLLLRSCRKCKSKLPKCENAKMRNKGRAKVAELNTAQDTAINGDFKSGGEMELQGEPYRHQRRLQERRRDGTARRTVGARH